MFVIYHHTKFHIPSFKGSLVVITKPKAKYRIHNVAMLFYVLQKH